MRDLWTLLERLSATLSTGQRVERRTRARTDTADMPRDAQQHEPDPATVRRPWPIVVPSGGRVEPQPRPDGVGFLPVWVESIGTGKVPPRRNMRDDA